MNSFAVIAVRFHLPSVLERAVLQSGRVCWARRLMCGFHVLRLALRVPWTVVPRYGV